MAARLPSPSEPVERMWRDAADAAVRGAGPSPRSPEFADQADIWPSNLDRRDFMKMMGASLALGGLAACAKPAARIVPYVLPPDEFHPGESHYYTSAMPVEGFGRGILVQSHLGRPTKIEGNPDHPESLGATDAITQAAVLALYDPDRSREVLQQGMPATPAAFWAEWSGRRLGLTAARGRGLALLTEPTTSPSLLREIGLVLAAFPEARWYQHTPLAAYSTHGVQLNYDFAAADVVLLIGSDCWTRHPASIRYSRAALGHHRYQPGRGLGSRIYAIESTPTLSGALADQRLAASPERIRLVLDALATDGGGNREGLGALRPDERAFVAAVAADLKLTGPASLCVAGPEQDADVQAWAMAMNSRQGAVGHTVRRRAAVRSDADPRCAGNLDALLAAMANAQVEALFILGSNPAYSSREFRARGADVGRIAFTAHVGSHVDETAVLCGWHLPEAHFLETWGDLRGFDGTAVVQQPLIDPLYQGVSILEVLHGLHDPAPATAHDLVRATWSGTGPAPEFESTWIGWLKRGRISEAPEAPASLPAAGLAVPSLARAGAPTGAWLLLTPDSNVADGRWSNNGWLQELPRPLTELVWDNAVLIGPAMAKELGVVTGDLVKLEHGTAAITAAAWVMPGQAADSVALSLGYGRTRAGKVGNGRGFDAYPLRPVDAPWQLANVRVSKAEGVYSLVSTQRHFTMQGRDPVHVVAADRIEPEANPTDSLYPDEWKPGAYAWGLSIDLDVCTGCSACVAACQAENNTPVVGKDQVARGREMHWIRIDRYFDGPLEAPRIFSQPVTCMHCENAPCEVVCPVGATVHSSEGLNMMVYNRCVGTRYCSNNCPYKVRRFNFLDYRDPPDSPVNLQKNPDVTVRERGVMEKCTYCVQRINAARIDAAKANRPIRDGEIRTACQQACPVEAIVFGNVADPRSRVFQRKREPRNYGVLSELNTRPRTTYLARVTAPATGGAA